MKALCHLVCATAIALAAFPAEAQDAERQRGQGRERQLNNPLFKAVEELDLTEEQKSKVAALRKEFTETMAELRRKGLTQELTRKRNEAASKAREEGKTGQEAQAAALASLDATDEQKELLKKASETQTKMQRGLASVLTREQIAKLPQAQRRTLNRASQQQQRQQQRRQRDGAQPPTDAS